MSCCSAWPRRQALLVVSSDLPELMGICDRVLVFSRGEIAGEVARGGLRRTSGILTLAVADVEGPQDGETQ